MALTTGVRSFWPPEHCGFRHENMRKPFPDLVADLGHEETHELSSLINGSVYDHQIDVEEI